MKKILLLAAGWMAWQCCSWAAGPEIKPLAIGAAAPDFKLPGVDGRTYALSDFAAAKILVIVFTCNHCPTAQAYEDRIKELVREYQPKGVRLVAINPNDPKSVRLDELGYTDLSDSFEEMKIRAQARQYNFPYLFDGENENVSKAYGPAATPHAFIFDAARKLRYSGRIDDSERVEYVRERTLRNALESLLAGKEIEVQQTPAFGCSIKWAGKEDGVKSYLDKLAAEPVSVQTVEGEGLKALRKNATDKVRLVNFWATWCGPCVTEFPELITIHRMFRHRAFELVTVAANFPDEEKSVVRFLKAQQASNRNLLFGTPEKYKLMAAFSPEWNGALPYTVLIAPGGKVLYEEQGAVNALELKRAIVKALKEDRFK